MISNYSLSFLIILILSCAIFIQSSDTFAQTQNKCDQELKEADEKFIDGEFEDALKAVKNCLDKKDITTQDKISAHFLSGQIYLANDDTSRAKIEFIRTLELDPDFKIDTEIAAEITLFNAAKSEFQSKVSEIQEPQVVQPLRKKGGKKWLWIGGGIAFAVGLIVIFWPPPPPPEDLPGPPGIP